MSLPESAFPVQVYTPPSSSDPFSNFKLPVMACAVLLLLGYGLGWVAQCAIEALSLSLSNLTSKGYFYISGENEISISGRSCDRSLLS